MPAPTLASFFDQKLQAVLDRAKAEPDPSAALDGQTYANMWARTKDLVGRLAARTRPEGTPASPPREDLSVHVLRDWAAELTTLLTSLAAMEDQHGYYSEDS